MVESVPLRHLGGEGTGGDRVVRRLGKPGLNLGPTGRRGGRHDQRSHQKPYKTKALIPTCPDPDFTLC